MQPGLQCPDTKGGSRTARVGRPRRWRPADRAVHEPPLPPTPPATLSGGAVLLAGSPRRISGMTQGSQVEEDALPDVGQKDWVLVIADGVVARLVEAEAQAPEGQASREGGSGRLLTSVAREQPANGQTL